MEEDIKSAIDAVDVLDQEYLGLCAAYRVTPETLHIGTQAQRAIRRVEKKRAQIAELVRDALYTDGGHHKQWYLEQIAEILGLDLDDHDHTLGPRELGIAP